MGREAVPDYGYPCQLRPSRQEVAPGPQLLGRGMLMTLKSEET